VVQEYTVRVVPLAGPGPRRAQSRTPDAAASQWSGQDVRFFLPSDSSKLGFQSAQFLSTQQRLYKLKWGG
jgi:hypothetical protein